MRHGIIFVLAAGCTLAGCQSDQGRHAEVSKAGMDIGTARSDVAACTYSAESSLGTPPSVLADPIGKIEWNNQRDHLATLCLQAKGYAVTVQRGSCQGICTGTAGNVELISN